MYSNGWMGVHNSYLAYYIYKELNTLQEQFSTGVWDIICRPMALWTKINQSRKPEGKKKIENQKGKTSFSHASVGKKYLFPPQTHFPSSLPEVGSTNNAHGFYPSVSNSS